MWSATGITPPRDGRHRERRCGSVRDAEEEDSRGRERERDGGPGQSRTADLRFRKSLAPTENKADTALRSADSGKVRNPDATRRSSTKANRATRGAERVMATSDFTKLNPRKLKYIEARARGLSKREAKNLAGYATSTRGMPQESIRRTLEVLRWMLRQRQRSQLARMRRM